MGPCDLIAVGYCNLGLWELPEPWRDLRAYLCTFSIVLKGNENVMLGAAMGGLTAAHTEMLVC